MKRNFNATILDLDGKPMKDGPGKLKRRADGSIVFDEATSEPIVLEPAKDATLKSVAFGAMRAQTPGDDAMSGADKLAQYVLADKIARSEDGIVDLSTEDITRLCERIGKVYDFVTYGRARDLLNQDQE